MAHQAEEPFRSNRNLVLSDAAVAALNATFRNSPTLKQFTTQSVGSAGGGLPNRQVGPDVDPVLSSNPAAKPSIIGTSDDSRMTVTTPAQLSAIRRSRRFRDNQVQKCPFCMYTCDNEGLLLVHLVGHCNFTDTVRISPSSGFSYKDNKYTCKACEFHTSIRLAFQEHIRCHFIQKPYSCEQCGTELLLKSVNSHNYWNHNDCAQAIVVKQSPFVKQIMLKLGPTAPHSIVKIPMNTDTAVASCSTSSCQKDQPCSSNVSLVGTARRSEEFIQSLNTLVDNTNEQLLDMLVSSCDLKDGVYACGVCKFSTRNLADILEHVVSDVKRWNCACSYCGTSDHYNCSVVVDVMKKLTQNQVNQDTVDFATLPITPIVIVPVANETPNQCVIPASPIVIAPIASDTSNQGVISASQYAVAGDLSRQMSHNDSYNTACGQSRPLVSFQTEAFGTGCMLSTTREVINNNSQSTGALYLPSATPLFWPSVTPSAVANTNELQQQTQAVNQFNLIPTSAVANTNQQHQQTPQTVKRYKLVTPSAVANTNPQHQQAQPVNWLPPKYNLVITPIRSLSGNVAVTNQGQPSSIASLASFTETLLPKQDTRTSGAGQSVRRRKTKTITNDGVDKDGPDNSRKRHASYDDVITLSDESDVNDASGDEFITAMLKKSIEKRSRPTSKRKQKSTEKRSRTTSKRTQSGSSLKRKSDGKVCAHEKTSTKKAPLQIKFVDLRKRQRRAKKSLVLVADVESTPDSSAKAVNGEGNFFRCGVPDCSHSYSDVDGLRNHMTDCHASMKVYPCPYCSCLWSDYKYFIDHILVHVGSKPYRCVPCDICFATNSQLKSHLGSSHVVRKMFKCLVGGCAYVSKLWTEFKVHIWFCHPAEQAYTCFACHGKFTDANTYLRHLEFGMETLICCPHCAVKSKLRFAILRHLSSVHQGQDTAVTVQIDVKCDRRDKPTGHGFIAEKGTYKCRHCDFVEEDQVSIDAHMESHNSERDPQMAFYCAFCPFGSQNMHHYMQHLANHRSKAIQKLRYFRCPYCLFTSNQMAILDKHLEGKHSEEPFKFEVQQKEVKTNEQKASTSSSLEQDALPKQLKTAHADIPQNVDGDRPQASGDLFDCSEHPKPVSTGNSTHKTSSALEQEASPKRLKSTHADIPHNVNSDRPQAADDLFDCSEHPKAVSTDNAPQKTSSALEQDAPSKQLKSSHADIPQNVNSDRLQASGDVFACCKDLKSVSTGIPTHKRMAVVLKRCDHLAPTLGSHSPQFSAKRTLIGDDNDATSKRGTYDVESKQTGVAIEPAGPQSTAVKCRPIIAGHNRKMQPDSLTDECKVDAKEEGVSYSREMLTKSESPKKCSVQASSIVQSPEIEPRSTPKKSRVESSTDSAIDDCASDGVNLISEDEDDYWRDAIRMRNKSDEKCVKQPRGDDSVEEILDSDEEQESHQRNMVKTSKHDEPLQGEGKGDNLVSRQSSSSDSSSRHEVTSAPFRCTSCSFSCSDSRLLSNHMRSHNSTNNLGRSIAAFSSRLKQRMPARGSPKHKMPSTPVKLTPKRKMQILPVSPKRKLACSKCSFSTNFMFKFRRHVEEHTEKPVRKQRDSPQTKTSQKTCSSRDKHTRKSDARNSDASQPGGTASHRTSKKKAKVSAFYYLC